MRMDYFEEEDDSELGEELMKEIEKVKEKGKLNEELVAH